MTTLGTFSIIQPKASRPSYETLQVPNFVMKVFLALHGKHRIGADEGLSYVGSQLYFRQKDHLKCFSATEKLERTIVAVSGALPKWRLVHKF